jgi:hypothetical protein
MAVSFRRILPAQAQGGQAIRRYPQKESIARKRKHAALGTAFLAETLAGANKLAEV